MFRRAEQSTTTLGISGEARPGSVCCKQTNVVDSHFVGGGRHTSIPAAAANEVMRARRSHGRPGTSGRQNPTDRNPPDSEATPRVMRATGIRGLQWTIRERTELQMA